MKSKSRPRNVPTTEKFQPVAQRTRTKVAIARGKAEASVPRLIEGDADVREGIAALRHACPAMRKMHDFAGDPPLRRNAGGFPGLARIIVGQQVSVASANAIWTRFAAVAQPMSAETVAALSDDQFREGGLSRPKIKTLRAISAAVTTGLDLDAFVAMDEGAARDALTAISGIGPWTADIYLMFCLGRADVFAPGDLALQEAARMGLGLDERPAADALAVIAEQRWRPWRGIAARLLWHYYAATKAPKSGQPV